MKLFVWDFHGVLEKGNDGAVLEITNRTLEQFGYSRRLTEQEAHKLSGIHWHEYFSFLLPHVDAEECLKLEKACIETSRHHPEIIARHIQINDHAYQVLEAIQRENHTQILISNTLPHMLDLFVKAVDVERYFPLSLRFGVDPAQDHLSTKKSCLDAFLQQRAHFETVISIGDSPGDMALLDSAPKGVGYLYAHPTRQHRPAPCDYQIHDLRLVLQELVEGT